MKIGHIVRYTGRNNKVFTLNKIDKVEEHAQVRLHRKWSYLRNARNRNKWTEMMQ